MAIGIVKVPIGRTQEIDSMVDDLAAKTAEAICVPGTVSNVHLVSRDLNGTTLRDDAVYEFEGTPRPAE